MNRQVRAATEQVAKKQAKKKPPLGSGARFAALKRQLGSRPGVADPGALAAYIGRKSLGKARFQRLAAQGRKRKG